MALVSFASSANAKLTRLEIEKRETVADGQSFGSAGAYEKLTGRAWFEVDPAHKRNKTITDLKLAPVNENGKVEFSADIVILKPVDLQNASRTLFLEVNNRGNKLLFSKLHDAPASANRNNPMAPEDFGNGFLMRRGHVLAWVGWEGDVEPGDNRLTVDFPVPIEEGAPLAGFIITEFSDRHFGGTNPTTLPLSGSERIRSYAAVSTDKAQAKAQLYMLASDSPTPSGPYIPRGAPVPDEDWAFANCPDGWPGTPSASHICLKNGFLNNRNYHLLYLASNPTVMALGFATTRDFISFLRNEKEDEAGNPNPVAGLSHTLCEGFSSSAMYLRDFAYQGFNVDENNHRVCDGMHIHGAGVNKLYLNYRFAQPDVYSVQHRGRFVPDTNFPRQYSVRVNPFLRFPDGILKRPVFDPKIIHTDTSTDYWQFRASLTGASEGGTMDFNESPKVRRYLLSSLQHGGYKGEAPHHGTADRQCVYPSNPVHSGPILRALVVALEQWVTDGVEPPDTQVPKIADH
ncbi:MAG: alpha/beta hydrolase domain-containing protein, partial [Burkholderiales bacterium]